MLAPVQTIEIFQKQSTHLTFASGDIIFEEGQYGDIMYGIIEGEVDIVVDSKVVETIKQGDAFGQGAIVDLDHKRAATAIAKTNCKLAYLDQERFLFAVQQTPMFAIQMMRSYSMRLRTLKHKI